MSVKQVKPEGDTPHIASERTERSHFRTAAIDRSGALDNALAAALDSGAWTPFMAGMGASLGGAPGVVSAGPAPSDRAPFVYSIEQKELQGSTEFGRVLGLGTEVVSVAS